MSFSEVDAVNPSHSSHIAAVVLAFVLLPIVGAPLGAQQENQKIIWVAHYKADCVGAGSQKCYLIKDNMYDPWKYWYDEIERLDWEEGFAYEVVVSEVQVPNPPADGSSIKLRVVELLTMINAESQPTGALPLELQDLPPQGQPISGTEVATEEVVEEEVVMVAEETIEIDPTGQTKVTESVEIEEVEKSVVVAEPVDPAPAAPPPRQPTIPAERTTPAPVAAPVIAAPSAPSPSPAPVPPPAPPPTTTPAIPDEELQTYRGHLTVGVGLETRTFKICGAESGVWVEDKSGENLWRTYRELSGYPGRPVFMVVRGDLGPAPASSFGSHYDQQLTVMAVQQASSEGPGCTEEVGNIDFIAFGNEPFWQVEISPDGIVYSRAGGADWSFPYREPMASQTKRVYWGASEDGSGHRIQVSIEEKSCRDTMADSQYSFVATVMIDDQELSGCARVGSQ
jgi:uncharacterized membrane protein